MKAFTISEIFEMNDKSNFGIAPMVIDYPLEPPRIYTTEERKAVDDLYKSMKALAIKHNVCIMMNSHKYYANDKQEDES